MVDSELVEISIHALREESDALTSAGATTQFLFQSTPSARRATRAAPKPSRHRSNFNPRPPRGERRARPLPAPSGRQFQSTPSARRATARNGAPSTPVTNFNPRPPRGERRKPKRLPARLAKFQSTPSARRATDLSRVNRRFSAYFNPRPPRGERQQKQRKNPMLLFHYTHLCTI